MTAPAATVTDHTRVLHPTAEPTSAVTLTVWDEGTGPAELVLDSDGPCPLNPDDINHLMTVLADLRHRITPTDPSPHPGPWDDTGGRR